MNESFLIDFDHKMIKVEKLSIPAQVVFTVDFLNQTPKLAVARAKNANGVLFWTSIPEGRQEIAEKVGILIENYYRSQT